MAIALPKIEPESASSQLFGMTLRTRAKPLHVFIVALVFFLDSGVPSLFWGASDFTQGRMIIAAIVLAALPAAFFFRTRGYPFRGWSGWAPVLLFVWIIIVSWISNSLVFGYSLSNWLFATYTMVPLLVPILWRTLGMSAADILVGIMVAGALAALLVVINTIMPMPQLNLMRRMSAFGEYGNADRLVIMKDQVVLGMLLILSIPLGKEQLVRGMLPWLIPLGLMIFVVTQTFESRMALLTVVFAIPIFFLLSRASAKRQFTVFIGIIVIGIPAMIVTLQRFIAPLLMAQDLQSYMVENNVMIRVESSAYYFRHFLTTLGLGIGIMSTSPASQNIISDVVLDAYNLNDLGLLGALYQFGVVGLILCTAMTLTLIMRTIHIARFSAHPRRAELLMVGSYVAASMIQPIPSNFFSLSYSCLLGATLWYAMSRSWHEAGLS